ncbi:MAG TPA: ATP-binding cassette domain-containing protein, partial [Thermoanaerobaculia bacterium]
MSSVLRIHDLRLRRGAREVLRGVSFDVAQGELVALMGLSGGGKTTVLRAITALEPFDGGTIDVGGVVLQSGRSLDRATTRELRRCVGMVFQYHFLWEHLTALQNVTLAPMQVAKISRADAERRANELL